MLREDAISKALSYTMHKGGFKSKERLYDAMNNKGDEIGKHTLWNHKAMDRYRKKPILKLTQEPFVLMSAVIGMKLNEFIRDSGVEE